MAGEHRGGQGGASGWLGGPGGYGGYAGQGEPSGDVGDDERRRLFPPDLYIGQSVDLQQSVQPTKRPLPSWYTDEFKVEGMPDPVAFVAPVASVARPPTAYAPRPPAGLTPQYGTLYGADYEAARAAGKFTPQQLAAADAAKARYAATPLGLSGEGVLIDSAKRKADLVAAGAEQTSVANALERDTKAQAEAATTERSQIASYAKMRSEFDQSQATRVAQMDTMKADIAATNIDPSQYFTKGNVFGNVLSLVAVALGGYAEGLSGGRLKNNALAMLQNSIDNDIAAQKANLDNKKSALGAAQSIYGLARQQFGDDQSAAEFTRARQNDVLKAQSLRFASEGRTEAIRANAVKLAEHFDLESKDADNRVRLLHANAEAARIAAAHRGGGGSAALTDEEKKLAKEQAIRVKDAQVRKTVAEADKAEREAGGETEARKTQSTVTFEGKEYFVPKESGKDLQNAAAAAAATQNQADSLIELGKGDWHQLLGTSKAAAKGEVIRGTLAANLAKANSGGFNPPAAMEERAQATVTAPPRVFGQEQWEAGIKEIPKLAAASMREHLKAAGATRVDGTPDRAPVKTHEKRK